MISETKVDDSFPHSQFEIAGYSSPFRLDRDSYGGGIMLFFSDYLPCRELDLLRLPGDIEAMFIEMKVRNTKYLIVGGYNPRKEKIS